MFIVVTSIAAMLGAIEKVDSLQSTISAAVEEQSVTTREIIRNVSESAQANKGIASSIAAVASAAGKALEASSAQQASQRLAGTSTALQALVSRFQYARAP